MKSYSKRGLERRKDSRAGLKEFFEGHVQNIRKERFKCLNCNSPLVGDVSEVAHRLPKSVFKSVMLEDDNVLYLCSYKSSNNCHAIYDGSNEQLQSMNIFEEEQGKIEKLLEKITEKYNWKLLDRWKLGQ